MTAENTVPQGTPERDTFSGGTSTGTNSGTVPVEVSARPNLLDLALSLLSRRSGTTIDASSVCPVCPTYLLGGTAGQHDVDAFRNRLLDLCESIDDEALVWRLSDADLREAASYWDQDAQLRTYIELQRQGPEPTSDELKAAQDAHAARWCSRAAP